MSRTKPILTSQHILEKEFRVDTKGYRMMEVDVFLDAVYEDYNLYEEKLSKLSREINEERARNLRLEEEISRLKARVELAKGSSENTQNNSVDMLKRLSELEKMVYKDK